MLSCAFFRLFVVVVVVVVWFVVLHHVWGKFCRIMKTCNRPLKLCQPNCSQYLKENEKSVKKLKLHRKRTGRWQTFWNAQNGWQREEINSIAMAIHQYLCLFDLKMSSLRLLAKNGKSYKQRNARNRSERNTMWRKQINVSNLTNKQTNRTKTPANRRNKRQTTTCIQFDHR